MKESQQGTVGFLFFTLAETHRGFAKSPISSPMDKDFIVQRCDSLSIYMYSPLAALNSLTLLFSLNSPFVADDTHSAASAPPLSLSL